MTIATAPIAITENVELNQFGFDGLRFKKVNTDSIGGYEWAGPCPICGGRDRCIVSNGFYWCRHSSVCGGKGNLASRSASKFRFSQEHLRRIENEQKRKEQKKIKEQGEKIAALNRSKVWREYHRALLKNFSLLQRLESEGITLSAINHYQLGYAARFRTYDYESKKSVDVPALSFPHFSLMDKFKCLNIRMRILDHRYAERVAKYLPWRSNLPVLFFPAFTEQDREIVIIEGEKKAIVLQEHGIPAIGLWGIHAVKEEWAPWIIHRFEKRYLVYDADNWGVIQATYKQAERLQAKPAFLNLPGKADDLLVAGKITPGELMEQVRG